MSTVLKRWTYDDLVALPEDNLRHEIIDGEHVVTPAPIPKHQRISMRLGSALFDHVDSRGLGEVFAAPCDVVFSPENIAGPDLLFIRKERLSIVGPKNIQGAPDLAVEVLSEWGRRRDVIDKRKMYERFGVEEYWIADPEIDAMTIYRIGSQGAYERVAELTAEANDVLTSPMFPGFSLPLTAIFRTF
jgi:Uma2 family endonuclease